METKLMKFQEEGINSIEKFNGRVLLADDTGLGKTAQSLSWVKLHPELRPAIIICPAFLKLNWKKECIKWGIDEEITIIDGKWSNKKPIPKTPIIVINYDILSNKIKTTKQPKKSNGSFVYRYGKKVYQTKKIELEFTGWVDHLIRLNPKVVISDEVHFIKNESNRSAATIKLMSKVDHIIAISATAFENKPIELFNIINVINPKMFPNKFKYGIRYCDGKQNNFGWEFKGATNKEELHKRLVNHFMIRRLKKDVLKDLPSKRRNIIHVKLTNEKEYRKVEGNFLEWLKTKSKSKASSAAKAEAITKIHHLEKVAYRGKINATTEWIDNFLENGRKLVVFAKNKSVVGRLMLQYKDIAVRVDGSLSLDKKQQSVDAFQNDPKVKILVGNIDAAGVGWTLTAASDVLFIQYPWSPSKVTQAEDRVHRIGQKAEGINIWFLVASGSIETERIRLLHRKQKVFSEIIDGVVEGIEDEIMNKIDEEEKLNEEQFLKELL